MATAAHTAPSFEVTAPPDIMDIHSDSGLDFDGEDIDLELRSPGQFDIDDDVSLKDVTTDGIDVHTTTADQDDFMADNEDLIEEDVSFDATAHIELSMMDGEPEPEPQPEPEPEMTNAEEDLIDYSDEEDETTAVEPVEPALPSTDAAVNETQDQSVLPTPPAVNAAPIEESSHAQVSETNPEEEAAEEIEQSFQDESYQEDLQTGTDAYQTVDRPEENEEHEEHAEHELYADEDAVQSEVIEPTNAPEQPKNEAKSPALSHAETVDNAVPDQSSDIRLHPVTINYDGAELWLFKHHDYESSGDYLIEESSLADKPISSVIEACRAALGSDVTDDIELGFRLDNFHNIELYQDHSSCAFVTLEHIVGVYLRLHSQDGVSEPESFYMSLLSRPRVHALLNTLNEAAEKGIGHVGLNKDIAAGLTSFTARLMHETHESSYDDWENEEPEHDSQDMDGPLVVEEHDEESYEEPKEDGDGQDGEEPLQQEQKQEQHTEENEVNVQPEVEAQSPKNEPPTETAGDFLSADDKAPEADDEPVPQAAVEHQSPSKSSHYSENEPDKSDIIDYSDDEDDGDDSPSAQTQPMPPSSASSTVQGDNTSYIQETANQEYAENDEEATQEYVENEGDVTQDYEDNNAEGDFTHFENFDGSFEDQAYGGEFLEANDETLVQQYTEALGEESSGVNPTEDNTNYNHEAGDQIVDQLADQSANVDDGSYDAFQDLTGDGAFPGTDVFLEFENADANADAFQYEQVESFAETDDFGFENEDDVNSQAPVAASTAAEPVVVSSSEPLVMSPQGQKRTIDEVSNDGGEATDSSDAKRPRV